MLARQEVRLRGSVFILIILFIPLLPVWGTVWYVPDDFDTIQEALDKYYPNTDLEWVVKEGDTIEVAPGIYPGFKLLAFRNRHRNITIRSSHGRDVTFIDGTNSTDVGVEIRLPDSCLEGFTVRNFNKAGIQASAKNLRIQQINCVLNGGDLTYLYHSGIMITAEEITLKDVVIDKCSRGIFFSGSKELDAGSFNCLVQNGYLSHCTDGIVLRGHNHLIENVTIRDSAYGFRVSLLSSFATRENIIRNCVIKNNSTAGIFLDTNFGPYLSGNDNSFYNNFFSGNLSNLSAQTQVHLHHVAWNIEKTAGTNILGGAYLGGNYFDDYVGADTDSDGLGDTNIPYNKGLPRYPAVPGDEPPRGDFLPLIGILRDLSVSAQDITIPDPPIIEMADTPSDPILVGATVRNVGEVDASNVEAALFANGFEVSKIIIPSLPAKGSAQAEFSWDPYLFAKLCLRELVAENRDAADTLWAVAPVEIKVHVDPYERIPDGNLENNIAVKSITLQVMPDIEVVEVIPIQTLRDVPMILDKPMMTRVFVRLAKASRDIFSVVHGVKVQVCFDDKNEPQDLPGKPELSLVNYQNKGYIVPRDEVNMFWNLMKNPNRLKQCLFRHGWDAFNLENDGLAPSPKKVGPLTLTGDLLNYDADSLNNIKTKTVEVKRSTADVYKLLYLPLDSMLMKHVEKLDRHLQMTREHAAFIEAVFPVPQVVEYYGYSRKNDRGRPLDPLTIHGFWAAEEMRMVRKASLHAWYYDIDHIIYIIPRLAMGLGVAGCAYPQVGTGVFVDETQGLAMNTSAHELGHTWGLAGARGHTDEYDRDRDIPALYAASDGWDVKGVTSKLMGKFERPKYSYAPSDLESNVNYLTHMGDNRVARPWITEANYRRLMDGMWPWGGLVYGGSDPRVLFVSGQIMPDGTAELFPFFAGEGDILPPQPGSYSFDCQTADGTLLTSTTFEPWFETDEGEESAFYAFPIAYPDGTGQVLLRHNGAVLAERSVSPSAPLLQLGPVQDNGDDWFGMEFDSIEKDGDELEYLFGYSNDGIEWLPVLGDFEAKSNGGVLTFDSLPLAGGSACFVKVTATDGMNTVEEVSAPFAVPRKSPEVFIVSPEDGAVCFERDSLLFSGFAYDPEDKQVNNASFVWTSDRDGEIGRGVLVFALDVLSLGEHVIHLEACDSDNNIASDSITVVVNAGYSDTDEDTLPDWWEIRHFDTLDFGAGDDMDNDGICNQEEYANGNDPNLFDVSGEGEGEGEEEGADEGEPEGAPEGEGEGVDPEGSLEGDEDGEAEGSTEGANEGEGETPAPCCGCNGCNDSPKSFEKTLGDWIVSLFGAVTLLFTRPFMRKRKLNTRRYQFLSRAPRKSSIRA